MHKMFRLPAIAALFASTSLAVTPLAAAELPSQARSEVSVGVQEQANWGYGRGRHRDNGISTGDVVAGVLVIGAIAAILGSGNKRNDRERYDERQPARYDPRGRDARQTGGIDSAVDMCVDQIERGSDRVTSVDNAARTADGWRVSGALDNGSGWNCWIDNNGRIREVDLGAAGSGYFADTDVGQSGDYASGDYASGDYASGNGQLSDETYARARASQPRASQRGEGTSGADWSASTDNDQRPAYPGGPLPGEEGYDEALQLSAAR